MTTSQMQPKPAGRWRGIVYSDPALPAILAAVLLSFAFWVLVWQLDFHRAPDKYEPDGYRAYFALANWWPFPFMFLVLAPAVWLTWQPFQRVWADLARTGVLTGPDRRAVAGAVHAVRRKAGRWRGGALALSLVIAVVVNAIDIAPRLELYRDGASFAAKLEKACREPSALVKWLFDTPVPGVDALCETKTVSATAASARCETCADAPAGQIVFVSIAFGQQFLITFFAALLVLQVLLHTLIFCVFEHLALARKRGARLDLNCSSPLNEFGLEHWNYALNNFYWAVCPAMLGVFLSRAAGSPGEFAPGQRMLGIAVPVILLVPMIATVLVRQVRLPRAWSTLQPNGPVKPEDFHRQQLWPLDRNWSAKLGIALAFALAALSLGYEFSQLVMYGP